MNLVIKDTQLHNVDWTKLAHDKASGLFIRMRHWTFRKYVQFFD